MVRCLLCLVVVSVLRLPWMRVRMMLRLRGVISTAAVLGVAWVIVVT